MFTFTSGMLPVGGISGDVQPIYLVEVTRQGKTDTKPVVNRWAVGSDFPVTIPKRGTYGVQDIDLEYLQGAKSAADLHSAIKLSLSEESLQPVPWYDWFAEDSGGIGLPVSILQVFLETAAAATQPYTTVPVHCFRGRTISLGMATSGRGSHTEVACGGSFSAVGASNPTWISQSSRNSVDKTDESFKYVGTLRKGTWGRR